MLLRVTDVAERLNVSVSLVYQLAEAGKIAVHRIGTGRGTLRFRPEDVDAYLAGCRVENRLAQPKPPRPKLKHLKI